MPVCLAAGSMRSSYYIAFARPRGPGAAGAYLLHGPPGGMLGVARRASAGLRGVRGWVQLANAGAAACRVGCSWRTQGCLRDARLATAGGCLRDASVRLVSGGGSSSGALGAPVYLPRARYGWDRLGSRVRKVSLWGG